MISFSAEIRVRYAETDAMGIVYHANYLPWFEIARIELLEQAGVSYQKLEEQGFLLPVLEANLCYKAPSRFGDTVVVKATFKEAPRVRFRVDYEVSVNGRLITTGYTMHAFMNRNAQAVKPPAFVVERINLAMSAQN